MEYDYINRFISSNYRKLGWHIGKHPLLFIFVPLIVVGILSAGFSKLEFTKDAEYLYCPVNGRARDERRVAETLFPIDENDFDITRMMRFGRMGLLLIEAKDGGSMLREYIIDEIANVNKIIENISITYQNQTIRYRDLCLRAYSGKCLDNLITLLSGKTEAIKRKKFPIKFPFEVKEASKIPIFSIMNFGGVTVDEDYYIEDIKAIRLLYVLKYNSETSNKLAVKWEEKFLGTVSRLNSQYLNFYKFVGNTFDWEFHKVTKLVMPYILMAAPLMTTFAIIASMTKDWVTSKPFIGIAGCICPVLGGLAGFGFLLLCGAEYIDLNISVIFLLIGVGLDDSFVLLAAWRRTNINDSVKKRMSDTYSEAAVSITITSLTNFLSFCIGMTTPYRVIRIYSLYASLSVIFAYLLEVTLFGGIMALSGIREKKMLHSFLFIKVNFEKIYKNKLYQLIRVGLVNKNPKVSNNDIFTKIYRDTIGEILTKSSAKVLVIVIFVVYIFGGIFCLRYLKEGFDYVKGFPYSSYAVNFTRKHYEYFVQYPHGIQIVINQTLDYSDPGVQKDVTEIVNKFAADPYMGGINMVDSWLKYYILSLNDSKLWLSYRGYDMTNPEDFIDALRNIFLKFPSSHRYKKDIIFNENYTQIVASRFLVVSKDIKDASVEKKLLIRLWNIADSCKYPVYVHNYWFTILNQHVNIRETTIQTLCIAAALITVMFFAFIPHIVCAICVAITIISIQVGVIGYMSLWSVSLDTVSMLILIMSTGLSVDYAAHISYAFLTAKTKDSNKKIKIALECAGHPIFQGCLSTVLGVVVLGFGPSYSFVILFKIISLAMFFSLLHGLFVLPVFLNVWENFSTFVFSKKSKNNVKSEIESKEVRNLITNECEIDKNRNKMLRISET
ncbi:patched domain-containing protein 3-like [Centruroides vittatus]|uniref:patched domain-containing protein 3-like n=1 Tax=Centruroides vittatus TaxID=120091 RepID=UPI0035107E20